MAEKKYNWSKIKKEWLAGKYKSAKEIAKKYGMDYSYARKKVRKWKDEKDLSEKIESSTSPFESDLMSKQNILKSSEDRHILLTTCWDKLACIVDRALSEPEHNFFTNEGQLKSKALFDISAILERIQKAYDSDNDKEATGQLGEYVKMFDKMKENQDKEGDE